MENIKDIGKAGKKVLGALKEAAATTQTPRSAAPSPASSFSANSAGSQPSSTPTKPAPKGVNLLVIQSDDYDWPSIFSSNKLIDGRLINVVQCGWEDILINADSHSKNPVYVTVRKNKRAFPSALANSPSVMSITFKCDFCLVRNEVYTPGSDYRNVLFGLMFGNVPSVNSLQSIYMFCERPIVQGELNRVAGEIGREMFPVVEQSYYCNHQALMYGNTFPAVVKVGAAHAGVGKMRINNHHDMDDMRSVLAMTEGKYCTVEPFIDGEFDLRIQKIGNHYRAFKRTSVSGSWKTNTGSSHLEQIPCTEKYQIWADKAAEFFGGLDILTVDAIHCRGTNQEKIMEVNGTSSGLAPECAEEDNRYIRDLVMQRMNAVLCR